MPLNDAGMIARVWREDFSLFSTASGGIAMTSRRLSQRYRAARQRHRKTYWLGGLDDRELYVLVTDRFCTGTSGRQFVNRRPPANP
jgi:hypothetical protein